MDRLAELLRQGADRLVNLPSEAQRFVTNPQAFTQLLTGKNPMPRETGFAAGATGLPAQEISVLDPNQAPYMQGYEQGEPIGYAGMAAPFAAPAAVATAKALAPKLGQVTENYMVKQGMMPSVVPQTRKEVLKQKLDETLPTIQINDKTIPVTMHPIEVKEGNKLVNVNPVTFDEAFKQTDWQYIGKNAEGGKKERITGVEKYLETGKPMNASNVVVKDNGTIVFGDGRHRYAVLRDMGLEKIPMSMDENSLQNAVKFGYIK